MINQQLLDYIKGERAAGRADADIKKDLLGVGWKSADIDEGLIRAPGGISANQHQTSPDSSGADVAGKSEQRVRYREIRQQATTGSAKKETENQGDDSESNADSYREPIEGVDLTGPGGQMPKGSARSQSTSSDAPTEQVMKKNTEPSSTDSVSSSPSSSSPADKEINQMFATNSTPDSSTTSRDTEGNSSNYPTGPGYVKARPVRTLETDHPDYQSNDELRQSSTLSAQSPEKTVNSQPVDSQVGAETPNKTRGDVAKQNTAKKSTPARDNMNESQAGGEINSRTKSSTESDLSQVSPRSSADERMSQRQSQAESSNRRKKKSSQPSRKSSGRLRTISITALILVGLLVSGVGGAYAYFAVTDTPLPSSVSSILPISLPGLSSSDGETISTNDVLQALFEVQSFSLDINITPERTAGSATSTVDRNTLIIEGAFDFEVAERSHYTIMEVDYSASNQIVQQTESSFMESDRFDMIDARIQQEIAQTFVGAPLFTLKEEQATERVNDVETIRFGASADSSELVGLYTSLHGSIFDEPLSSEVLNMINETVGSLQVNRAQVWIDPSTNLPHLANVEGITPEGESLVVTLQFSDYNASINDHDFTERSISGSLQDFYDLPADTMEDILETSSENVNGNDSSGTSTDDQDSAVNRRQDALRVNDLQQIEVALSRYWQSTDIYPLELSSLVEGEFLESVPRDPVSGEEYTYSVAPDGSSYHLGATLREVDPSALTHDVNFDSESRGWTNGFNGLTDVLCGPLEEGAGCYDITN